MAKVQLERRQRLVDVCKSIIADPRNVDDDVVSAFKRAALKYVATQYADTTQGFRDLYKVKGKLGDLVLLPRVMLDNEGKRFLDDMTVDDFTAQIPTRVEFVRNAQETIDAIRSLAGVTTSRFGHEPVRVQSRL